MAPTLRPWSLAILVLLTYGCNVMPALAEPSSGRAPPKGVVLDNVSAVANMSSGDEWVAMPLIVPTSAWRRGLTLTQFEVTWGVEAVDEVAAAGSAMIFHIDEGRLVRGSVTSSLTGWTLQVVGNSVRELEYLVVFAAEGLQAPVKLRVGVLDRDGRMPESERSDGVVWRGRELMISQFHDSMDGAPARAYNVQFTDSRQNVPLDGIREAGEFRLTAKHAMVGASLHASLLFFYAEAPRFGNWTILHETDSTSKSYRGNLFDRSFSRGGVVARVAAYGLEARDVVLLAVSPVPEVGEVFNYDGVSVLWPELPQLYQLDHRFQVSAPDPL